MFFLASNGYRCVGHDRRGHGRSSQPWGGNEMDSYADDLAELIEALDLEDIVLIGFSTGGGEISRYIGRHGTDRVAKAALISSVPPLMLKTESNPYPEAPHGITDTHKDALNADLLAFIEG
jgi:non-heme chloroperoxidase